MNILGYDPYVDRQCFNSGDVQFCNSLSEIFSKADIITLHVPNIPGTHKMVTEAVNRYNETHCIYHQYQQRGSN